MAHLFFDIGNVLVLFDPRSAARAIAQELQISPFRIARYLWSSRLVERIEKGELSSRQLHALFKDEFGFAGDFQAFERLWCGHFRLERRTAALFERLRKRHKVYLLSNTNELHWRHIRRRWAFAAKAHGTVLSFKLGTRKPEPAIYHAALRLCRARPGEAIFIDDRRENVRAAQKAGMAALLYRGHEHLLKDLKTRGVLW